MKEDYDLEGLDDYSILSVAHDGLDSQVFHAKDKSNGNLVYIKVHINFSNKLNVTKRLLPKTITCVVSIELRTIWRHQSPTLLNP